MLLTGSAAGCNDERPDTTSDSDPGTTDVDTAYGAPAAGGSGSQAEPDDDITDGTPSDSRSR